VPTGHFLRKNNTLIQWYDSFFGRPWSAFVLLFGLGEETRLLIWVESSSTDKLQTTSPKNKTIFFSEKNPLIGVNSRK
jgi:hypothetical protein